MTVQVEGTNDSSCLSKYSAVIRGYFDDEFLCYFATKCPRRAPLIHLGYSVRAGIINALIDEFVAFSSGPKQIVSFGAGFDTLFFKLTKKTPNSNVFYYELDLPRVVKNKISCIKKSSLLCQTIGEFEAAEECLVSSRYKLLAVDLRVTESVKELFNIHNLSRSVPTLFLSECAITYIEEGWSSDLIKLTSTFENATFVTYEQINPDDMFGQVMLKHFCTLQSPLLSVTKFPTLQHQAERYIHCGWQYCSSTSALDAYNLLVPAVERQRVLQLEPFDEWEELYLKCVHYAVTTASNGRLQNWSKLSNHSLKGIEKSICLNRVIICPLKDVGGTARYGHNVVQYRDQCLVVGGFGVRKDGTHGRIEHITWLKWNGIELNTLQETEAPMLSSMYSSCTSIPSSDEVMVVYGGRRSPRQCTFTSPQMITVRPDGGMSWSPVVDQCDRPARWRHTAVVAKWNNVHTFIVFGGRTDQLSLLDDTWMIPLHQEISKRSVITIPPSPGGPCARFSHSCSVRHNESGCDEMWMTGGHGSSGPLSDVWCLDLASLRWQRSATCMRARFNHTTSIINTHGGQSLVMVGGVNWSHDLQPCVAVLDLQTGAYTEYDPEHKIISVLDIQRTL